MIPTPQGWRRLVRIHEVRLLPPQDNPIGEIRYRERYGPLRPATAVARARLATATAFKEPKIGEPERLVTNEGEYAALLPITGKVMDRNVRRFMGIVFGDNFTTLLDGIGLIPESYDELGELVRDLTTRTTLVLGTRKRRFLYTPPENWQSLPNVFVANWYPPEFPKATACITVYPATPTRPMAQQQVLEASAMEERAKGSAVDPVGQPETITSDAGLTGTMWRLRVQPRNQPAFTRHLVAFDDARYIYPLRLDTYDVCADDALASFNSLLASAEPVPGGDTAPSSDTTESVDFWIQ